jgi:hypothetical protein
MATMKVTGDQLQKIFHDGITSDFRRELKQYLLKVATQEIDRIVEESAAGLVGKITEYNGFNTITGMTEVNYLIKIDGVEKVREKLNGS